MSSAPEMAQIAPVAPAPTDRRASPVLMVPQLTSPPAAAVVLNQHPYERVAVPDGSPASVALIHALDAETKLNAPSLVPSAPATETAFTLLRATAPDPSSASEPAVKLCKRTGTAGKSVVASTAPLRARRTFRLTRVGAAERPCAIFAQYSRRTCSSVRTSAVMNASSMRP